MQKMDALSIRRVAYLNSATTSRSSMASGVGDFL